MSTTNDNHYYQSIIDMGRAFYDWEVLLINLGCKKGDIDLKTPNDRIDDNSIKDFTKFVHEYIHYLQNFSTNWGVPVYTDFLLSFMKMGASSLQNEDLSFPLNKEDIEAELLKDSISLRENVLSRLSKNGNQSGSVQGEYSNIKREYNENGPVILSNGKISCEIGLKCIREHMAHLGVELFFGNSDTDIHEKHKALSFSNEEGQLIQYPEYWIVFEHFFSNFSLKNVGKGTFFLAQECLTRLNPDEAFKRFLDWFERSGEMYILNNDLPSIVDKWLNLPQEIYSYQFSCNEAIKHVNNILELCKKHKNEHDVYRFGEPILEYAIRNLYETKGGRTLFKPNANFSSVLFWKKLVEKFGTGILVYKESGDLAIHGTPEHCDKMYDSFLYALAMGVISNKLFTGRLGTCPFLEDLPICHCEFKEQDNCYKNPFLVTDTDTDGKVCLFRGGVQLLGMESRLNFHNND